MKRLLVCLALTAVACSSPPPEETGQQESALGAGTSRAKRDITVYAANHWSFVLGTVPGDGNLPASETAMTVETPRSKPVATYFSQVRAGTKLRVSTGVDGIDKFGQPPEYWTGECYDSCLPRERLVQFERSYLGYKIEGRVEEVELTAANGRAAMIDVPATASGNLEYWFRFVARDGRTFWDSRSGQNYVVPILPKPSATVRFGSGGPPTVDGTLVPGGSFRVEYSLSRIRNVPLPGPSTAKNIARLEVFVTFGNKRDQWSTLIAPAAGGVTPDVPSLKKNNWTYYEDQVLISPVFGIPDDVSSLYISGFAEAINLDVSPVIRESIFDIQAGLIRESQRTSTGRIPDSELFELTF